MNPEENVSTDGAATTEESTIENPVTTDEAATTEETTITEPGTTETTTTEPQIVVPVEIREMTRIETEKGNIHVIHEITIGDLLVSTLLFALLIFTMLSRVIGGYRNV